MALLYIVLVAAFFCWTSFHGKRERRRRASMKQPLLESKGEDGSSEKDNELSMKVGLIFLIPTTFILVSINHILISTFWYSLKTKYILELTSFIVSLQVPYHF